jgi:hypothetical protein
MRWPSALHAASVLSFIAFSAGCGGHVNDLGVGRNTEAGGSAGAATTAGTPNRGGGSSGAGASGASNETGNGGPAGRVAGGGTGGATSGNANDAGGAPDNAGGTADDAGGTPSNAGGTGSRDIAGGSAPGGTLSVSAPQVWVGETTSWVTYPDPVTFDRPEHVVLVLNPEGSKDRGSIVLGDRPPPPPATDPDAFYPPIDGDGYSIANFLKQFPLEGQPYTLLDVWQTDARLTFQINPFELWKDWCRLQTRCSTGPSPEMDGHAPRKSDLCGYGDPVVCTCEDSVCSWTSMQPAFWSFTIDLELRGALLEGQVLAGGGSPSGLYTLGMRLTRVK